MRVTDERAFLSTVVLGFVASSAVTIVWCGSMSVMPGMDMPGGWTMSMAWMPTPGRGWPVAAGMFIVMWTVMMVAMMLPAFVPMVLRYRNAIGADPSAAGLTLRVIGAYFGVWALAGGLVFAPGVWFGELAMRVPAVARAVPLVSSAVILLAGAWQLSAWKARQLACCRETVDCCRPPRASADAAWRHGVDLGWRCVRCCAPLTALLFVLGVMQLSAMALVTLAITIERLSPRGDRASRVIGAGLVAWGLASVLLAA